MGQLAIGDIVKFIYKDKELQGIIKHIHDDGTRFDIFVAGVNPYYYANISESELTFLVEPIY